MSRTSDGRSPATAPSQSEPLMIRSVAPQTRRRTLNHVDTGSPTHDAEADFGRARRRQQLARLASRLRREPDDVNLILPFDEVVEALGRRGERRLGLETIELDSIVAAVMGGVALSGGRGTIPGALAGAAILVVLSNAVVMVGMPVQLQIIVKGIVIIVAASLYVRAVR